ncbi:MAG: phosphoribosylanthranilate isomerase [Desulfobacterales bacterium]|nr:phosphoribosylanthranilate isomerase [Desulfobacterales bacterium]
MKNIIVQIYEIQTPYEAEMLIEIGVDHIGSVIVSEETWKVPQIRETISLTESTDSKTSLIPLFGNPDNIFRTLDYYRPDIVHFCEALANRENIFKECEELKRFQEDVKKRFPEISIMRSIPIAPPGKGDAFPSIEAAKIFESASDYFLTDTLLVNESKLPSDDQPVIGFVGITGQICDWDIAVKLVESSSIPVILAGGISPDNVSEAILHVRPAGVDSCTATNAADTEGGSVRFKKDPEKVKRFVEAAKETVFT